MDRIDVKIFKEMLLSGAANLENHAQEINAMNVFPVPDGDTGTNMSMTFTSGCNEAVRCSSDSISDVAKALSKGLLMGARGNSGVITSQIFRGFYQYIEGKDELDVGDIAGGFENGARVAYKAIMKPVEGTILTVIREGAWYANNDYKKERFDLETYMDRMCSYLKESLDHTPDYLPVLKEVGVVDSGGAGLLMIFEGFREHVQGRPVVSDGARSKEETNTASLLESEEYGYCTEFIVRLSEENQKTFEEKNLKKRLSDMGGESLVVVRDDELVKVHVHVLKPGDALNIGQRYGEFIKLKIENMKEQHSALIANEAHEEIVEAVEENIKPKRRYGLIAVAAGDGLSALFDDLGVDCVISGGQTMNPSTEDFCNRIMELDDCENIIIFPNNSNIILAAKQARDVIDDRNIFIVETKSIQAGVSAVAIFNKDAEMEENMDAMKTMIDNVYPSSITYAIKDTSFEGVEVKQGDYIAIADKTIVCSGDDRIKVIDRLLDSLLKIEDKELLTIYKGIDGNDGDLKHIEEYVSSRSRLECDIIDGGQPVYKYLFSLE